MSPVKCLECGLIWPSMNKAWGDRSSTNGLHRLAYACIICSETFAKCKDLHSHEATAGHKPPKDLEPIIAAARAAAASGPGCSASAAGPSHAAALEDSGEDDADSERGEGGGGYSCAVCYMEFETDGDLTDHVSNMLPCAACMTCISPFQSLEDHYWDSDNHPKCRPCALGFENTDAWKEHKLTCTIAPLRKEKEKPPGRPRGRPPGAPSRAPPWRPAPTATNFETTSGSSTTVSSVTMSSNGSSRPATRPYRPPPKFPAASAPQPARPVPATNWTPQMPFSCSKCKMQYPSEEALQKHFTEASALHPRCRTCGMRFEDVGAWGAHRARCPPPVSSTSVPAIVNPVSAVAAPEASAPANSVAVEPSAAVQPSGDGRSPAVPEHPSRSSTPGTLPQPNAFTDTSMNDTTLYAGAEQVPTTEDPPSVPMNGETSSHLVLGSSGETEGAHKVIIDGRDEHEEMHWYDPTVRAKHTRPGPGVLPPLLATMFHAPNHALYAVTTEMHPLVASPPPHAPTPDEVHAAIPHWNASFCPAHNGWVLLQWRASSVLPPLVKEPPTPLPNQNRRAWPPTSCAPGAGREHSGNANVTHHWHRYEKVVDAATLNPPYARGELLLDLYLCCQCSMNCLVSDVIPGVIPPELVDAFTRDKAAHPVGGKTPEATAVAAWETVLSIIDKRLWKDERRSLPVSRPRFREKIGWNSQVERVFEVLGFRLGGGLQEPMLQPPPIDPSTTEGRASRTTLLRAWVELSAWLAIYREANKEALKDYACVSLHVKVESERDLCEMGIGAHNMSQTSRGAFPGHAVISERQLQPSWKALGMAPSTHSWEHLMFAYLAQCRCDPANTMVYFTHLVAIVDGMDDAGVSVPDELRSFIEDEKQKRGRFTMEEHAGQARILGFGHDNDLGVELDDDNVDDEFIAQAWRCARESTWLTVADESEKRTQLDAALKVIAEQRGSVALVKVWNKERGKGMAPETAYQILDVPKETDETMVLAAYVMQVEDRPDQSVRMREALSVLAESKDSERLRQFLITGRDPEDAAIVDENGESDSPADDTESQQHSTTPSASRSASPETTTAMENSGQLSEKQLPAGDEYDIAATTTSSAKVLSFHCRSCQRDPCIDPVATVCGHLFCHSCIVDSLATRGCCPVCRKSFLIRLHVEVDVDGS